MQRELKLQREADPQWALKVSERIGGEGLFSCLQCGTCSGTCPLSIYMDYGPRRIIGLAREGFRDDVLKSNTIWMCASCYSCAVNCPRQIHITDVMYGLKCEAIKHKLYPARMPIPILAQEFYNMIRKRGRSSEFWLVLRMALRSNPFMLLGMWRSGWDLFRTGRLSLRQDRIKDVASLPKKVTSREVA